jgi:acid phosphatase family membrane protein YuiD
MLSKIQTIIFVFVTIVQIILNILTKYVFHYYSENQEFIKRPNAINGIIGWETLGMPSGHTETITVFCSILTAYYKLPLKMGIFSIITMMLQRVVTKMHTLRQVIYGLLTGLLYSCIYIKTGLSYKTLIFIIGIIYTYLFLIEKNLSKRMKNIPHWVDKEILINKNRNIFQKMHKIFTGILYIHTKQNGILYYSYEQLKNSLDIFINKLNTGKEKISSEQIDVVVGVKTSGAIIGKYIAKRLNKPYYSQETVDEIKDKSVLLIGKNTYSKSYLENMKETGIVYPYVYNSNNMFHSISDIYAFIWPWG